MSRSNGLHSRRPCRNLLPVPDGSTAIPQCRQRAPFGFIATRRRPGATTGKPANLTNQPKPKMTTILENLRAVTGSLERIPLDELAKFETLDLGPEWLALLKSGLTIREIMCLQNVMGKATLKKIGAQIGVTRERIRQSRERALRRLRHPKRKRLAKIMPPQLHLAVYGKLPEMDRQP